MSTRHERRALRSRRLEATAIGAAVLLTAALCQLAPDDRAVGSQRGKDTEGVEGKAERGTGVRLSGTGPPPDLMDVLTQPAGVAEASDEDQEGTHLPTRR